MRRSTRAMTTVTALVVAASPAAFSPGTAAADSTGPGRTTFLPFAQTLRRCDFSAIRYSGPAGYGRATAVVRSTGSNMAADVQLVTALPGTRYDVRLIQLPHPSSVPCNAGDPGTSAGVLNTDAAGAGSVTVQGPIVPGATHAWVFISRPAEFSQTPAEFYTTDYTAAI
jgi:hypothetical protein